MRWITRSAVVIALACSAAPAGAAVRIGPQEIVVTTARASAVIARAPFGVAFRDAAGRTVLSEVPAPADGGSGAAPPIPVPQAGGTAPSNPALYAPLVFTVGGPTQVVASPAGQFEGDLLATVDGGVQYSARAVLDAVPLGDGVRMTVSTSDPTGRRLTVDVAPASDGALRLSARPGDAAGVSAMGDAFSAPAGEAYRGFGGRHNALDQHGQHFVNWLQQENASSGELSPGTDPVSSGGDRYLFPNGPQAAYYVQSSFVSSAGYAFLLDRDEISDWRMASDRSDAWRTAAAGPALDYVVAPGDGPTAIGALTAITGRQQPPPDWGTGPMLDRLVRYPSESPADYLREVEGDLRDIDRYRLPLDGYRIEAWQGLPRATVRRLIDELHRRGIHALLYFRSFVGKDTIGTDDPGAYDEALAKGYVATDAAGQPYTFVSNFNERAAQIDFSNPAAVAWWQGRIREALDLGADGFMEDFGEQVLPDMHFADGTTGLSMHNRLPVLAHRATREAIDAYERAHPGRRILTYTRSGYSGTPGSAAFETANFPGDETTDFSRSAGLASQTTDMLNRGVGGAFGFTTDIGGYLDVGPYQPTTKELFIRWAEWAALSPMFRLHGSVHAGTHTPWSYDDETVRVYRELTALHQRAEPLIRSLWRTAARTGIPIARPLWLGYPDDATAAAQDQEWLLGPDVLVAPVVDPGVSARTVYFPAGCWVQPAAGREITGPTTRRIEAPLTALPFFFRCGTEPFRPSARATGVLPSARRCVSRRRFAIHLRGRLRSARVRVGSRRVRVRRRPGGLVATVDLRGRPRTIVRVRVRAVTRAGRRIRQTRSYRTCRQSVHASRQR